ncbi:hypothetical protein PI124_g2516 [Phytophthora idaei]|nr:hypothetical protein PI125_g2056 [Phytophthora idaei]KAG3171425.1 hypothetical protein PI126_g1870 [Phytophthora idaei]KAG3252893.1 hypothetical protein PI124_g2516 [Phytophthora idaei]
MRNGKAQALTANCCGHNTPHTLVYCRWELGKSASQLLRLLSCSIPNDQGTTVAIPSVQQAAFRHNAIYWLQHAHRPVAEDHTMNQGCTATLLERELAAFALPVSLDHLAFADLESLRLDDSLDVLGFSAPVLADVTEPANDGTPSYDSTDSNSTCSSSSAKPSSKTRRLSNSLNAPPKPHRHHSKKASRKQVHELQVTVDAMQTQVDSAAAEIQQLAQLVGQFALQREQEQQEHERVRRREQQLFEEHEMDMDLDMQQRHLCAQVKRDREQFEREQQCFDCPTAPLRTGQETFRF